MFSYDISWSATIKEVERSNFFKEIPKIAKRYEQPLFRCWGLDLGLVLRTSDGFPFFFLRSCRFWFPLIVSTLLIAGMVICSTSLVPIQWRVDGTSWGVIFPLSYVTSLFICMSLCAQTFGYTQRFHFVPYTFPGGFAPIASFPRPVF